MPFEGFFENAGCARKYFDQAITSRGDNVLVVRPAVHNVVNVSFVDYILCLFRVFKVFWVNVAVHCLLSFEHVEEDRGVRFQINFLMPTPGIRRESR